MRRGSQRGCRCSTELTSQTGLAVGTVRRAIGVLTLERLVRTVPGRGTFVIPVPRIPRLDPNGQTGLAVVAQFLTASGMRSLSAWLHPYGPLAR
jgi:DNA-binding GntR family transcriptional regulator